MMVTADDDSSGKFAVFSEYTCQPYSYAVPSGRFSNADSSVVGVGGVGDVGVNFKGGKGQSQKRFSNFFSFFGMKLLWDDINNIS